MTRLPLECDIEIYNNINEISLKSDGDEITIGGRNQLNTLNEQAYETKFSNGSLKG